MNTRSRMLVVVVLMLLALTSTGCFWRKGIETHQVGLVMKDGVSVSEVVGPGRYTNWDYYGELFRVDCSAKTTEWDDPDLVTLDKQPVGFSVSATYARMRTTDDIKAAWQLYNAEMRDDAVLRMQVLTRIPRVAKELSTMYTLDQILGVSEGGAGGRTVAQDKFYEMLAKELAEIHVQLLDVGINNISPSPRYLELLEEKANAKVAVEVAQENTRRLTEELKTEVAQTDIDLELARRTNLVAEEEAKVYTMNERWFELKYLEALAGVIGENDKWFFVDPDTDVTTIFMGGDGALPVVSTTVP